ncbi:MAG: toxin-antitoxin system YwqK family antitoxin [Bacteroidales bacterium]|nr:toxin-antitoxin system YwqK family antitoxin [Bacteroidales bacterium]
MECSYLNGHRDGIASYYAPDGKTLLYETLWENDGLVSISYAKADGTMSEPVLIGKDELEVKAYYPNGKVGAVIHFNNGLYNGAVTIYYPNGQSFTTRNYTDDLLNGTYIFYYPNGQIYQSIDYVYDELHGKKLFYYDNGQINTEEDYFYSSQHGKFIHYDKNGNVLHKFSIRCDTREGELE